MDKLFISEILEATNGKLLGNLENIEKICVESVSIDSRNIKKNALFIPLHGENINSHKFINDALLNGAIATLTDEKISVQDKKIYIMVDDTLKAMQDLASFYRKKFDIPFIGITGSVGKTSTKEMISCVLESKYKVLKTQGNLNGQVGLPLTIFNLDSTYDIAVVEMGVSEPDEMNKLSKIAKPNYAVISNVGVTHIENFKTKENILNEKFKITNTLNKKSTLFINGDNHLLSTLKEKYADKFDIIDFGIKKSSDYFADNIIVDGQSTIFDLIYNGLKEKIIIPVIGEHNVYNSLAAIALGLKFDISIDDIKLSLKDYKTLKMRQCIYNIIFDQKTITLIDDTYNANPDSMKSALKVLSLIGENKRKIAILSDMLELGKYSDQLHFQIGEFVIKEKVDILLAVGEKSKNIVNGAKNFENDFNKNIMIYHFDSNKECFNYLIKILRSNDTILAKGSRGMHLEEIINKLIKSN